MKLLPITSESIGFKLVNAPDAPAIVVGESIQITTRITSPMSFFELSVWGHKAAGLLDEVRGWRIDEVTLDDVSAPQAIESSWGVGSVVRMKVTNVGPVSAHFHAIWRLSDATS
jgi:hypothetical protein